MSAVRGSILVVGGTGKQGQPVCLELLNRGFHVSFLTRNSSTETAQHLISQGATAHLANLDSYEQLLSAMKGVNGVFLALPPSVNEVAQEKNVIRAGLQAGVKHLVYSSVARTGDHESFPMWNDNYPLRFYWLNKAQIESDVQNAGFETWTILRPAFFMQNFCRPICEHMFPGLSERGELRLAYHAHTRLHLIHVRDIGEIAAEALSLPDAYAMKTVPLAAESLTAAEIAAVLSESGRNINLSYLTNSEIDDMTTEGILVGLAQVWQRDVGYGVDVEKMPKKQRALVKLSDVVENGELGW